MAIHTTDEATSSGTWHIGANINRCDGGNMGYGGPWAKNAMVGSADKAGHTTLAAML